MTAGRLMVRADDALDRPAVRRVAPKLSTDEAAAQAAAAVSIDEVTHGIRLTAAETPRRGRAPELVIELDVPSGTQVRARTGEGQVVGTGRLGSLLARTSSGSVGVEQVSGPVDVRTGRGPVTIHECGGGSVDVTDAVVIIRESHGPLTVRGRSGDVHVWSVHDTTTVTTSTGNVRLGWATEQPVALHLTTDTGRQTVSVPQAPGADASITVRTITGDISVSRAKARPATPTRGPRRVVAGVREWAARRRTGRA